MLMLVSFEDIAGRRAVIGPMPSSVKEWAAIVSRDPFAPGGLSREFLQKDRGSYAMILPALKVGDVIEWGGRKGKAEFPRHYWTIITLGFRGMLVESLKDKDEVSEALELGVLPLQRVIGEAIELCSVFGSNRFTQTGSELGLWMGAADRDVTVLQLAAEHELRCLVDIWNHLLEIVETMFPLVFLELEKASAHAPIYEAVDPPLIILGSTPSHGVQAELQAQIAKLNEEINTLRRSEQSIAGVTECWGKLLGELFGEMRATGNAYEHAASIAAQVRAIAANRTTTIKEALAAIEKGINEAERGDAHNALDYMEAARNGLEELVGSST